MIVRLIAGISVEALSAFLFKGFSVVKGPVLIILLVVFLTPEQQGYWYLITNLGALVYMADFGLASLTMQHIANNTKFDQLALANRYRFLSLIKSSYKFLYFSIGIVALFLIPTGFWFLDNKSSLLGYAWLVYVISSVPVHLLLFELSILQGLGGVVQSYKWRSGYVLLSLIICIALLALGMSVMSLGLSNLLASVIIIPFVMKTFSQPDIKGNDFKSQAQTSICKRTRFQYITSWLSGYAMFFMIVPLVMYFEGAVVAGQVGMGLALVKAIGAVSLAPMESSLTALGKAFGGNDKTLLMRGFRKSLIGGGIIFFVSAASSIFLLEIIRDIPKFHERVPDFMVYNALLLAEFIYFLMSMMAKKVRILLIEPYAIPNIIFAFAVVINGIFFLEFYGIGVWSVMQALLYLLLGLPLFYKIYLISMRKAFR